MDHLQARHCWPGHVLQQARTWRVLDGECGGGERQFLGVRPVAWRGAEIVGVYPLQPRTDRRLPSEIQSNRYAVIHLWRQHAQGPGVGGRGAATTNRIRHGAQRPCSGAGAVAGGRGVRTERPIENCVIRVRSTPSQQAGGRRKGGTGPGAGSVPRLLRYARTRRGSGAAAEWPVPVEAFAAVAFRTGNEVCKDRGCNRTAIARRVPGTSALVIRNPLSQSDTLANIGRGGAPDRPMVTPNGGRHPFFAYTK